MLEDAGIYVECGRLSFTVNDSLEEDFSSSGSRVGVDRICTENKQAGGTPQSVVFAAEIVAAAVPGANGFARGIVQDPTLARLHARLVDQCPEHLIVVAHDDSSLLVAGLNNRIPHGALVALDVEFEARRELDPAAVVEDGQKRPASVSK